MPNDPLLEWTALVEEGRRLLEQMTDERWTDFNVHDPGITILEAVAYALTDLAYRAGHPVRDLMADSFPLPGAAESLSSRAVTLSDMRRVGLDVSGTRNVWIEPSQSDGTRLLYSEEPAEVRLDEGELGLERVSVAGVYDVLIEKSSREDLSSSDLAKSIALRLHSERNLGEDFDSFTVLEPQAVAVLADVEISDPASSHEVMLEILERIDRYLSPRLELASLAQLRRQGLASDAIFDGPLVELGVAMAPERSQVRRPVIHLSDLVAEIASAQGVSAVRRVRAGNLGSDLEQAAIEWSVAIDEQRIPTLDIPSSRIRIFSGGCLVLDSSARPDLAATFSERRRSLEPPAGAMIEDALPPSRERHVAHYRPLREDLPIAYGVRRGALGPSAPPERRGAANQLRAYLSLIDALLANFFSQLAGASKLLAPAAGEPRSYFVQAAERPVGEEPVISKSLDDSRLQDLVEIPGSVQALERRARFLGHLLARFGESVPAVTRPADADAKVAIEALVRSREAFLRDIPRLTSGRGSGANLLIDGEDSPLVERIRLKLGLSPSAASQILLVEHVLLRGESDDLAAAQPLLSSVPGPDPYSLQLSFVLDEAVGGDESERLRVTTVIREECPAHLVAYIRWLESTEFETFAAAYREWLAALRRQRRERLGFAE
jgi:hypothetical protein